MKLGGSLRRTRPRKRARTGNGPEKRPKSGRTRRRRKTSSAGGLPGGGRFALQLLGLVIAGWAVGYLVATRILYPAPPPPADLVEVPDVRGVGLVTARERLADSGLELGAVDSLRHPTVARDQILGQAPLPGQLARPGAEILVTRSLGPQRRAVPDLTRVDAERARMVLETSGFVVVVDTVEAEVPRGRVVSTAPESGAIVALPAEVRMEVSRGPPLVPMPLLLGLEEAAAVSVLDSLGLVLSEVEEVFRFGRDQGIVVEQQPPADTPLERGSAVRLAVGRRGG